MEYGCVWTMAWISQTFLFDDGGDGGDDGDDGDGGDDDGDDDDDDDYHILSL